MGVVSSLVCLDEKVGEGRVVFGEDVEGGHGLVHEAS